MSMSLISYEWNNRCGPVLHIRIYNHNIGLFLCHRIPERSIPCFGILNIFCARCLGLFLGSILGLSFIIMDFMVPQVLVALFLLPLIFDGFGQFFGFWESKNSTRLATGVMFSVGIFLGF